MSDTLKTYRAKRNFALTAEPAGGGEQGGDMRTFVIQKHWASRLHYDVRLELDGVMKSWAVPKGPSYDGADKRLAVQVEDHPIAYNRFEGQIPAGQYGAGKVIIWDKGYWLPLGNPGRDYADGNLKFELYGHKLHGKWALVRMQQRGEKQPPWLLIKEKDGFARPAAGFSVTDDMPDSVALLPLPPAPDPAGGGLPVQRLPASLSPQLATLVEQPPATPEDWLFEIKLDGYRLLARIDGASVRLYTRNGNDWSAKLPQLCAELGRMRLPAGWYDGEIVVHDQHGRPDFGLLQMAFDGSEKGRDAILYFLFDLPFCEDRDLRRQPLEQRRQLLQVLLSQAPSEQVRFSMALDAEPRQIMETACRMGLEGIIGKRRDAPYVSGRSRDWIKLKCGQRQEFVIGGYTDPQGGREGFGSLLLGLHDRQGRLHYAGNVGSGFDSGDLRVLGARLRELASDVNPFAPSREIEKQAHWVRPELLAEVSFGEWTHAGSIRHAVFKGLRSDRPAHGISRESARHLEQSGAGPDGGATAPSPAVLASKLPATLKVSHPERVIDPGSGTTKLGLLRYYALVSELMLVHLKGRPVALLRAPSGLGGELFFQKHAETGKLPGLRQLDAALDPGHPPLLEVASAQGLLEAAQWNVVEFHTQNAYARSYQKPNRIVFDLDPGKGVEWPQVREAVLLLRALIEQLGLAVFLKTSGGKGLHLVVPLRPYYGWDAVKGFAQALVAHMAHTIPERFVRKSGAGNRVGKIYIDYLRNGRGATTVCAWSARMRPGLPISVPLDWDELARLERADYWSVSNIHSRLEVGNTPWDAYGDSARGLAPAMKRLGFKPDDEAPAAHD